MNTVKVLMNGLFKRIIHNQYAEIKIYEPREYKNGRTVMQEIDRIDLWHYFVAIDYVNDKKPHKIAKKQHRYDDCEADWYIYIPQSPADVSEIVYSIDLKQRFTTPRKTNSEE